MFKLLLTTSILALSLTSVIPSVLGIEGSIEARSGSYYKDYSELRDNPMNEIRLKLERTCEFDNFEVKSNIDFLYDGVRSKKLDLEKGDGAIDIRELYISAYFFDDIDLKLGRQILTWGTGDLLFINDLFPKDWQSFMVGRSDYYLKAPSDALKGSWFSDLVNVDLIYTPQFDADRFITGERASYYSPQMPGYSGKDTVAKVIDRDEIWKEDEIAIRAYKNISGFEVALYGYDGYWKSPAGQKGGLGTFPELTVIGGSIRGNILNGIGSFEIGYYDSEDDDGNDPLVANNETRYLVSYEQELIKNFSISTQLYLEHMQEYDAYKSTLPAGSPVKDEFRWVTSARLTQLFWNQTLRLSQMILYSPSDKDYHVRLNGTYNINDQLQAELGSVIFGGEDKHTFYSQFRHNNSIFAGIKYGF